MLDLTFNMKYSAPIFAGLALALGGGTLVALAQTYTPLAPLPIGDGGETPAVYTLTSYLSGMIKLLVAVAGAIAVLMLVIGGAQYVAGGISPSAKSDAKERITNAVVGLILVLTSYLILNSIDPRLVKFDLGLPPITGGTATAPGSVAGQAPIAGAWPSDATERAQLLPVDINKSNCTSTDKNAPGGSNCTSVYGLMPYVITKIKNLKSLCRCSVIVTAGTEYWLHKSHNNNRRVDLSKDGGALDAYITAGGRTSTTSCGSTNDPHYQTGGAIYVDEPNRDANGNITGTGRHWHVCY